MGNDWKLILTCNNLSVQNKKIKKGQIMVYLSRYVVEIFLDTPNFEAVAASGVVSEAGDGGGVGGYAQQDG